MNRLEELLAVQDLDVALDQLRHRRSQLPERRELADIEARATDVLRQRDEVQAARDAVADRQQHAETELAATEQRATAVQRRLFGGEVSASRDLQALSAEADHLKERISHLEDTVLALLEEREPLETRCEALARGLEEMAGDRTSTAARLAEAEVALDAEIARTEERRAQASSGVDPSLLSTYERLRRRLGGVGVARLVGSHCDGCHLALSSAELEKVRHLPEGELYTCEQCSRILVP